MATVEKLSIALTPEIAKEVRMAVKSGDYASSSEVIREALRDWRRKRALQDQEIKELRGLWREGVESGDGRYDSMEEIKRAARKRLANSGQ
ncbi:MAG: type II toxin-antitoxin system ParD family antitoxin [gamma proteobacterium endosymbiont of Lamellibrachia anaximandri]|nr:type II toxin-antitoxin system ParD family antitoxin [gamma proteobacterium endosymbiont of Lamellibrachia anaximandri]MBL3534336.1 type II toxin-antitoxin system ParD family antitoxin [gamma proteobacterium endosymbiont of Lamellibrachia anaximandri]MBL3599935.1 type II toxin-antitoxin system ParD family antitoxin [gamma proteobacterium endosymbiont of Lamellibrachia anaximandri]